MHSSGGTSFQERTPLIDMSPNFRDPLTFPKWVGFRHLTGVQLEGPADPPSPDAMIVEVFVCCLYANQPQGKYSQIAWSAWAIISS